MEKLFLIIFCIFTISSAEDNATESISNDICQKCKCNDEEVFTLDCSNSTTVQHVLDNWPTQNKTIIATYSYNNITSLKRLPFTDQKIKVVFDHCNIKYIDEGMFANVKNVEYIDLSYNFLTREEIDGEDFRGPYNNKVYYPIAVKYLNLGYNQIHSLPRKFFENMPDLEDLNLAGNDFSILDTSTQTALSTLKKLKVLNLADNELTELVGEAIQSLENLIELDLSSNHLEVVPETLEYVAKSLKIVKLSNNYIFELNAKSFIGLNLVELYLDNLNRLEFIKPNTFSTMKNLKILSINNNINLKEIDKQSFSEQQELNEFYLANNSLTNIKYEMLNWSTLKVFSLQENPLECSCDLYNISKVLNESIKRSSHKSYCINIRDGSTSSVYSLGEGICGFQASPYHIYHASRHFEIVRSVIITLSLMLTVGTLAVLAIAYMRYKKGIAFRNYPFTAQVSYVPVTTNRF